jgi:hypothetical protein
VRRLGLSTLAYGADDAIPPTEDSRITFRGTFDVRKKAGHAVPTIAVARWGKWRGRLLIGGDAFAGECDGVPSNVV